MTGLRMRERVLLIVHRLRLVQRLGRRRQLILDQPLRQVRRLPKSVVKDGGFEKDGFCSFHVLVDAGECM